MTRISRQVLFLLMLLGAASTLSAQTKSLDQFAKDLYQSAGDLDAYVSQAESSENELREAELREAFARIEKRFPKNYSVETTNGELDIEFNWLNQIKQKSFASESELSDVTRVLNSARDRFIAIAVVVEELNEAAETDLSKSEQRQKLEKILANEKYSKNNLEEESIASRVTRWINDFISSLFPDRNPKPKTPSVSSPYLRTGLQTAILVITVALVIFLLIRFGPRLIRQIRKQRNVNKRQTILGEEIAADAETSELFADAERLALEGDIRGAIRKGYVSLLFELGKRRVVRISSHKTNRDYLRDVGVKKSDLAEGMKSLTSDFERYWYGRKKAEEEAWKRFRSVYEETLKDR